MSIKGVSRNDVRIGIERGKSRKGEIVEYGKRGLRLPFNRGVGIGRLRFGVMGLLSRVGGISHLDAGNVNGDRWCEM